MFEAAGCSQMVLVAAPSVSVDALGELQRLLSTALKSGVLKAEHLSSPDPGGACATHEETALSRPADTVSTPLENSALEESSGPEVREQRLKLLARFLRHH
jgi:hypothetical protein